MSKYLTSSPTITTLDNQNNGPCPGLQDEILQRLQKVSGPDASGEYTALCPFHEDHNTPNFKYNPSKGVFKCWCCEEHGNERKLAIQLGVTVGSKSSPRKRLKAATRNNGRGRGDIDTSPVSVSTGQQSQGCTLEQYAAFKNLPVEFLQQCGLSDVFYLKLPAVRIIYFDEDGTEVAVRFRIALQKDESGDNRFRWRKGSKPTLYGRWRRQAALKARYAIFVEGESDCHVAWKYEFPAFGIPGANLWKEDWCEFFDDIPIIYAWIEPDKGGDTLLKHLLKSRISDRVRVISAPDAKDLSELHQQVPANFQHNLEKRLEAAVPLSQLQAATLDARAEEAWKHCRELAQQPDILQAAAQFLARRGVAGEQRTIKLLYLIVTSRLLTKPASAVIKGPSAGGKSFTVERVLSLFPVSAYFALSAMSERSLAYSQEPLSHRVLVLYEAAGMSGELASYLIRSLLSEGRLRYETVEKTKDGLQPKIIEREGPTALLVTTTAVSLHPENETRLFSIPVTDTPEQTRHIFRALAAESEIDDHEELSEWYALQEWLEGAEHRVTIPFAATLADAVPPSAVRLRRDFGTLLSLIRAHALLHQANRQRDRRGCIIATLADYTAVRALVKDLIAEGVEATVPTTLRAVVQAVIEIRTSDDAPVSISQLTKHLKLDKAAVSRRVSIALARGYLKNLETVKGRAHKLLTGEPLPEDQEILPTAEQLKADCCTVDTKTEGIDISPSPTAANDDADLVFDDEVSE